MHISQTPSPADFNVENTERAAEAAGAAVVAQFASSRDADLLGLCGEFDFFVHAQRECWAAIPGDECEDFINLTFGDLAGLARTIEENAPTTMKGFRTLARTILSEHSETFFEDGLIDHDLLEPEMVATLLTALAR